MAEGDYFKQALGDFVRNFAYGDEIKKLVKRGYDTDRIVREMQYPLSDATIDKMVRRAREELILEGRMEDTPENGDV
ncbi:MAG: hypothetical protein J5518_01750 [Lachnospiraceae bacterium]|nr:hypothetical protein [Lachnospiraceae bacterium]